MAMHNAGMMIFDLEQIYQKGLDAKMLAAINREPFMWLEQDCINKYCTMKVLPSEWNASQFSEPCDDPKIKHWAYDIDNWLASPEYIKYRDMTWEEAETVWKKRQKRRKKAR